MMIDTGAAGNLIKQKILNPGVPINSQNVLKLTGINDLPPYTLGQVKINIFVYLPIHLLHGKNKYCEIYMTECWTFRYVQKLLKTRSTVLVQLDQ